MRAVQPRIGAVLELILLLLAIAALVSVRRMQQRLAGLIDRIDGLQSKVRLLTDDIERMQRPSALSQLGPAPDPRVSPARQSPEPVRPAPAAVGSPVPGAVPAVAPRAPLGASLPSEPAPPPTVSLEERLGTRWAVWIGGLALALGGLLLVRYSIEQGWFGPAARIVLGLLFSMALIAAGEWFRRGEHDLGLTALPSAHIPGILTAAGTSSAFGTLFAAHAIYGFIGPALTFLLLGAVGIATMLAAALHGPALAGLGLAGSYVVPLLVTSQRPSPWPVVLYLGVVAAAAMGLARLRQWLWLAGLAVAGACVWGFLFLHHLEGATDWLHAGYLHVLLQLALTALFIAIDANRGIGEANTRPDRITAAAFGALVVIALLMLLTALAHPTTGLSRLGASITFIVAAAAVLMGTAWLSAPAATAAPLAGLIVLAGVLLWPGVPGPYDPTLQPGEFFDMLRIPENVRSYLTFATLASLAMLAAATLRLMRSPLLPAPIAGLLALGATVTPLGSLVLAYLRVTQLDASISFGFAGGALATVFAILAERLKRREIPELAGTGLATAAFAAAAIAAFSLGLVAFMDRGYLTVALALTALGTAWIAVNRDVPLLRHVVTALALIVLARIAWDPRIMGDGVGHWPILNWLLVGYGIPAACFFGAARLLETRTGGVSTRIADATAVLLAGLLCYFEIHHALNGGDPLAPTSGHVEQGLLALVGLGLSHALMRLDLGRANPVFHWASLLFGGLAVLHAAVGLGVAENPYFTGERVAGPTVLSSLALAYLLPGLAATLCARACRPHRPHWYVTGVAALAALLVFAYVTLEVRHAFQGEWIGEERGTGPAETWAYSAAWLALGILFLGYGILRSSLEARIASALLVLLSVAKVFLFDLAGLTGIWRPLSFIVLGAVLIGIGLVYQRLMFAGPAAHRPKPD